MKTNSKEIENRSPFESLTDQIGTVILGKSEQIRLALTCLFARGHLLIEDLPGIGKTTLAKALARSLGLDFQRVQFTSDLLPGDVLGTAIFDPDRHALRFYQGPIFTQVLLADEINRATPKTQSALLEAMEENQVTIEGKTRMLPSPFFVIATQNPLEHFGTFPLPESQLDRFLMRIELGYPGRRGEQELLRNGDPSDRLESLNPILSRQEVMDIQERVTAVHASDPLLDYLQDLLEFTRASDQFHMGLSPRAGLALLQAARSWAVLNGRDYALPEDLQRVLPWVAGHRLRRGEDLSSFTHEALMELLMGVPIP